uniref:Histone 1 n=1 Tax=Ornithodoros coriaceus TaxID=92741 RepID=B2D263_ORNCO|nr:histone 1 [Ornithodoros coriaceus]
MSAEAEVAKPSPKGKGRKSGAAVKKAKKPANHPKYTDMVKNAIVALKERGGSSRQAIHKYIMANYDVGKDTKVVNTHLKQALKRSVQTGVLKRSKGTGASGSFRLADKVEKAPKKKVAVKRPAAKKTPVKPKAAKKPAAKPKKAASPKKAAAKPKVAAKAAKPKAAAKPKTPKKTKPVKKASPKKPKAKKATPAKKAAKK